MEPNGTRLQLTVRLRARNALGDGLVMVELRCLCAVDSQYGRVQP